MQGGYCENCQNQIDVLILRKGARRKQYTSVYSVSSIIAAIEVKSSYTYFSSARYDKLKAALGDAPLLYLAYWHQKATADKVLDYFGKDAFVIEVAGKKQDWGKWDTLVQRIEKEIGRGK